MMQTKTGEAYELFVKQVYEEIFKNRGNQTPDDQAQCDYAGKKWR